MSNKIINIANLKHYNDKINQTKQDVLISGQNIKTLNGESIIGEGDIKLEISILPLTYSELVSLRDNSQLVPGQQYRIIDYVTTTIQENTQSAGHPFDVIVFALSENTLAEEAYACQSEFNIERYGDSCSTTLGEDLTYIGTYEYNGTIYHQYESESGYQMLVHFNNITKRESASGTDLYPFVFWPSFAKYGPDEEWEDGKSYGEDIAFKLDPRINYFTNNDLSAWKLWYCLDNDNNRFTWADTTNGKGVIYRMIDEFDNDIPYDFKNILYIDKEGFKYNQWGENYQFTRNSALDKVINGTQYYGYSSETTPIFWSEGKCWVTDIEITPNTQLYKEDGSAISFGGTISNIITQDIEYYTFRKNNEDDSLYGISKDNVVKAAQQNGTLLLNKNVFGVGCYSNKIGYNSLNNTFGDNCCENTLLGGCIEEQGSIRYCANNSFGNGCCLNVFGYVTFSNTFGENCNRNSFENGCYGNSFGNECYANIFGNECYLNIFGNSCHGNSFENGFYGNSFGNECEFNSFGNECYSNSFGERYRENSFGDYCSWNIFDANCWRNRFNNNCFENTFGENCNGNSFGNNCYENSFGSGCNNNSFGSGCNENILNDGFDGNSFGNNCYENSFGNGCLYNSFGNHCYSNSFGESCEFNSFGNECYSNSFGESCESNSFGNGCNSNSFGNSCDNNSFGNSCDNNSFGNSCDNNSFGNGCNNNSFRLSASETGTLNNYCSYNHFDDGCSYNIIWNGDTTTGYILLKNININRGVSDNNSSTYNFINIDTLNANYKIQVAKNSSGVIKVYCEADLIA